MRYYLLDLRAKESITQQDVAERVGISKQYYQMIESGRRQADLNTSMIGKFAEAFGVSAAEIYQLEAEYQAARAAVLQAQGLMKAGAGNP